VGKIISQKLHFFIGDAKVIPTGIIHVGCSSTFFYSPRVLGVDRSRQIDVSAQASSSGRLPLKAYYSTDQKYADIYEFIFACRVSMLTESFFFLGVPTSIENFEEHAVKLGGPELYNIVSGAKVPIAAPLATRRTIARYLSIELHYFSEYVIAGLGNTKVIQGDNGGQPRIVSAGGHMFSKEKGWVLNVCNVPIGMLIDYYRIESGIAGMNGQLSFTNNPEYRFAIYENLRNVFVALIRHNPIAPTDTEFPEHSDTEILMQKVADIIRSINT
jgi:hypothetical protein